MPNTETWGIIGLGWLGGRLSAYLQEEGQAVWGTHRSDFDFRRDSLPTTSCDVLFLNTPPLTDLGPQLFCDKVTVTGRLIFISSTSVFGMSSGNVTEDTPPTPETDSARWLFAVETLLRERFAERLTVIRPGGLIGGERHPAKHLSGKVEISGGNEKINLIHREDLIGLITSVPAGLPLVHAVAPYHPRKDDYYGEWAEKLKLTRPLFKDSAFGTREIDSAVVSSFYNTWKCPRLDFI
jgi:hypothetical protein